MNIAIVNVYNSSARSAINKDLNGGFGTRNDFGSTWTSRLVRFMSRRGLRLPIVSLACLNAVLRQAGHRVEFHEIPPESAAEVSQDAEVVLIYGSIVDYRNELSFFRRLKLYRPSCRAGFVGAFPSVRPDLFTEADFVVVGEPEALEPHVFESGSLSGEIRCTSLADMQVLPTPCYDGFPIGRYSYRPALSKRPFLTLEASRGCPYSCGYYCTYGNNQGAVIRQRSASLVVDDMSLLVERHGARALQFRDPIFGLRPGFAEALAEEILQRGLQVDWGIETRLDLLDEVTLRHMHRAGLRNINAGIETSDLRVAKLNKRLLVKLEHQEGVVRHCKSLGVNLSAFYIIGLEGDDEESVRATIDYAIHLNAPLARFAMSTPYPGTGYYKQLESEGRILTRDYEEYTQFNPVHTHGTLDGEQLRNLLEEAYRRYYFRPAFVSRAVMSQLRQLR
jgi:radical SAM superfamily enzyme YgiQ (UPF0313 family)